MFWEHEINMPRGFGYDWFIQQMKDNGVPITMEEDRSKYLDLNELGVSFVIVKTNDDLQSMKDAMVLADCVGIDTENYALAYDHPLQLVQIAFDKTVYLIRQKYKSQLNENLRMEVGHILGLKEVLFFASRNDKEQLSLFFPHIELVNVLDIQLLVQKLGFTVPDIEGNPKQVVSLSDCCEHWLGKPLNKACTLSNWATDKELSFDQTVYAALDAYVLVAIYDAIKNDDDYKDKIDSAIKSSHFLSQTPDTILLDN